MKKILFAVMAMIAIGLTSCTNKAQQSEGAEAAEASISALTEQLEAGDASKFAEVLTTVKEKIAEFVKSNPEVAKEYVTKVQEFSIASFPDETLAYAATLFRFGSFWFRKCTCSTCLFISPSFLK